MPPHCLPRWWDAFFPNKRVKTFCFVMLSSCNWNWIHSFSHIFLCTLFMFRVIGVMLQVIPSFWAKFSEKSLFDFPSTLENHSVSGDNCIAHHDDKMCFLALCRTQFILLGDIEELPQKLVAATRTLPIYTSQFSVQWQNCCQKWTIVR